MLTNLLHFSGVLKLLVTFCLVAFLVYKVYRNSPPRGMIIICIFFLFYFFIQYCKEIDRVFSASPNLHTFDAVTKDIRWPKSISLLKVDENEFGEILVAPKNRVVGVLMLTSFRSGMPAYIFNKHGVLVDSTLDHHDDLRYQEKWQRGKKRKIITESEFLELLRNNSQQ